MGDLEMPESRPSSPSIEEIEGLPEMSAEEYEDVSNTFVEEYKVPIKVYFCLSRKYNALYSGPHR